MGDAKGQRKPPTTVVGVVQDALIGMRIRKSFGSRVFWGLVVSCYWISGGLFYKVSFDDGDVDIFSSDEVLEDIAAAKQHAKEELEQEHESSLLPVDETAENGYVSVMRMQSLKRKQNLKRKREDGVEGLAPRTRRVRLWGQRLYASIYTNMQNETFIKKMIQTDDGGVGEMEATGEVEVGDMVVAVNETRVLGMTSKNVAALIRKPNRPITLTFYRPPHPAVFPQQQENASAQDKPPGALSVPATNTAAAVQTQQVQQNLTQASSASSTPLAATISIPPTVASAPALVSSSLATPQQPLTRPLSMVQKMAAQWIQQTCMSQAHDLSASKGLILQRMSQIAAARQASYMFGYPPGVFVRENVPPAGAVSSATGGTTEYHQVCSAQRVVSTAPTTRVPDVSVPTAQYTRPVHQVRASAPVNQPDSNHEHSQQQHAGGMVGEQVQQIRAVPVPSESSDERILSGSTIGASSIAKETPVPEVGPEQTVSAFHPGQEASKSRQTFDLEITSDRTSGENMSCESLGSTCTVEWSTSSVGTNVLIMQDAEASVTLDERSSETAEQAMDISTDTSLPPSNEAPEEDIMKAATSFVPASALGGETQSTLTGTSSASNSMSFLSPSAFSGESSVLPRRHMSAASMADYFAQVESSVGLVSVRVFRRRLNLTLGVQGTLIAVTSFVKDEAGRPGEVEASGKVFIGDVLVRVNGTFIISGLTPGHVANIVNRSSRPLTLWFKRASWDILDGKA